MKTNNWWKTQRRSSPSRNFYFSACFVLCAFALNAIPGEVARVGSEAISVEAVRQTIARNGYNIYEEASAQKALDDLVRFELLATEAKHLGLEKDPKIAEQVKQL